MGTMPRMEEKAHVEAGGNGTYKATFGLSMGGTWELAGTIDVAGASETFHATVTTGIAGVVLQGVASGRGGEGARTTLLEVGPERLQTIGVRFAEAKVERLSRDVDAVGVVESDQTHREEVTLRVSGYLVKQFRGRVGDLVKAGDPLFSVYSPDLVTAQNELFLAETLKSGGQGLLQAAVDKLKNLGLSQRDVHDIRKSGKARRDIVIRSKIDGTILEISAREGAALSAGQVVYVIGDLRQSYVVARVFQQDLSALQVGQEAFLGVPGAGDGGVKGKVALIYSEVEQGAGTANVRIEVSSYVPSLRPGIFVDVRMPVDLGEVLTVPAEAVLYSGHHRYVFVDRGRGALEPREVQAGRTAKDKVEILSGLAAGDRVVSSGTFLLGSEAQLRSALPKWRDASAAGAAP
jgi:Cu(I)/Ag(I) efflux system membrane fusion protein